MKGTTGRRIRRESAITRIEKTILAHEANTDLTKRIVEDHIESTSEKFMKFDPNFSEEQIEKFRKKKIERNKITLENTKNNLNK